VLANDYPNLRFSKRSERCRELTAITIKECNFLPHRHPQSRAEVSRRAALKGYLGTTVQRLIGVYSRNAHGD